MRWWGKQRRWNIWSASCLKKQEGTESHRCTLFYARHSLCCLLARGLTQPLPWVSFFTTMWQWSRWAEGAQRFIDEFGAGVGISALVPSDSAPPATMDSLLCPTCSLGISCSDKLLFNAPGTLEDTVCSLASSSLWIISCDWQFNIEPKWAISGTCWDMVLQAKWLWLVSEWILRIQLVL